MFLMQPEQIREFAGFAFIADKEARSDLSGGFIASEDDYTSNFTGALRRIIRSNSHTGLEATSFVLSPVVERQTGCDATIIVTSGKYFKIAIFEAKWPRMKKKSYQWDYAQTASGISHYSDQLQRQAKRWPRFAVFEMFYCESPFHKQPKSMQPEGSTCVWHDDAIAFDGARPSRPSFWQQSDLSTLFQKSGVGIAKVIEEICKCRKGQPEKMWGDAKAIAKEFALSGPVLHVSAAQRPSQ